MKRKRIKKAKRVLDERPIYNVYYLRREDKVDTYDEDLWGVFYVGKGQDGRAYRHRKYALRTVGKPGKKKLVYGLIHRFLIDGVAFIEEIMFTGLTEREAFEIEMSAIAAYGRIDIGTGCLANHTDGGEGISGIIRSDETRNKISKAKKGKPGIPHTEETRNKISESSTGEKHWAYGTHPSEVTLVRLSESHMGQIPWNKDQHLSEEHCQHISESLTGRRLAEEHKVNIGNSCRGEKNYSYGTHRTEEQKRHQSIKMKGKPGPNKGRIMPEDQKKQTSESLKLYNKSKRWDKIISDLVNTVVIQGGYNGEE